MSNRFTEEVQKKNCKTCGKTIRTNDKLKTECRECVLQRENRNRKNPYSDEASGYEKQGLKAEMEGWEM